MNFLEKKDITKQEELKHIIKTRFRKMYGFDLANDIVQFIIDNICIIRHQRIVFHSSDYGFCNSIFNGYVHEVSSLSNLIRRRVETEVYGSEKIRVGYKQNNKTLIPTTITGFGLVVVSEMIYTTGVKGNDAIYSETYKLHIYWRDNNESIQNGIVTTESTN